MFVLLLLLSCGSNDLHTEPHVSQHLYAQKQTLSFLGFGYAPKNNRLGFTSEKPGKIKLMSPGSSIYADSFTPTLYSTDED